MNSINKIVVVCKGKFELLIHKCYPLYHEVKGTWRWAELCKYSAHTLSMWLHTYPLDKLSIAQLALHNIGAHLGFSK